MHTSCRLQTVRCLLRLLQNACMLWSRSFRHGQSLAAGMVVQEGTPPRQAPWLSQVRSVGASPKSRLSSMGSGVFQSLRPQAPWTPRSQDPAPSRAHSRLPSQPSRDCQPDVLPALSVTIPEGDEADADTSTFASTPTASDHGLRAAEELQQQPHPLLASPARAAQRLPSKTRFQDNHGSAPSGSPADLQRLPQGGLSSSPMTPSAASLGGSARPAGPSHIVHPSSLARTSTTFVPGPALSLDDSVEVQDHTTVVAEVRTAA